MNTKDYSTSDRRQFVRIDFVRPLACKVCKPETINKILTGYTSNISNGGLLCKIDRIVNQSDILWLSFDRGALAICQEIEKNILIYQGGIIGKVVRIEEITQGDFEVGVQFITRSDNDLNGVLNRVDGLDKS